VPADVHLLWYVREREQEEDVELLIGVYDSVQDANAAIERLKHKPGFADFPEGFQIAPYVVNRDHWTQGFVIDKLSAKKVKRN
jgi:hypothetical protein